MTLKTRRSRSKRACVVVLMFGILVACADGNGEKPDAGPDAGDVGPGVEPLTACPSMPFDHNDMPCVGDFLCRTPVKCCNGGAVCSEQGHQCMNGVFKYLGFNDSCVGQPP